jgi:hypothetical protein
MLVLDCIPTNVFGNWKRPFYDAALVCRSWTPHAQRKIFHQFIFKLHLDRWSPFPTRAFTRLAYLARHPHLAAHVMYLHFRTSPYVQPADVIASANLLAAIFPNVTGLILRSPDSVSAVRSGPVLDGFSRTRDRTSGPGPVLGQISDRTDLGLDRGPVPVLDQVGPS